MKYYGFEVYFSILRKCLILPNRFVGRGTMAQLQVDEE